MFIVLLLFLPQPSDNSICVQFHHYPWLYIFCTINFHTFSLDYNYQVFLFALLLAILNCIFYFLNRGIYNIKYFYVIITLMPSTEFQRNKHYLDRRMFNVCFHIGVMYIKLNSKISRQRRFLD